MVKSVTTITTITITITVTVIVITVIMASRYDVQKQATVSLLYSATTGDVTALRRFHGQVTQDYDDDIW